MEEVKFTFEDLKVYEKAMDFIDITYSISSGFPKEESYGLSSQFIKAATSIALNIAEGSGDTDSQCNRYLQIAINSVKVCVVCVNIARRLDYLTNEQENDLRKKLVELSKMITGLKKYLKSITKD